MSNEDYAILTLRREIASRLLAYRKLTGDSIETIRRRAGVPVSSIVTAESHNGHISREFFRRIVSAYCFPHNERKEILDLLSELKKAKQEKHNRLTHFPPTVLVQFLGRQLPIRKVS